MLKPEFDIKVTMVDSNQIHLTDYATSDALDWMLNYHRVMGYPRVILISDEAFNVICNHPMILESIGGGIIITQSRTLYFRVIDVMLIADSSILDCREVIESSVPKLDSGGPL